MLRKLRIAVLLLILLVVAMKTWQEQHLSKRWRVPLYVSIYPIAADDSAVTRSYLDHLDAERFKAHRLFFRARGAALSAVDHRAFPYPPAPGAARSSAAARADAGMLSTALWSLKLRYWAWRESGHAGEPEDIRVFVLYHDPALTPSVPHSLGLTKGLIGVVYAFAAPEMNGANDVVVAHEMLHTLGATDKYDLRNDAPIFPDGYGDPQQVPLLPQQTAELMAGRRMVAPDRWEQVSDLDQVVLGAATAAEIKLEAMSYSTAPRNIPKRPSVSQYRGMQSGSVAREHRGGRQRDRRRRQGRVNRPPASVTIAAQAAMSRMLTSDSITASILPAASRW
jgi:hypothetical protein